MDLGHSVFAELNQPHYNKRHYNRKSCIPSTKRAWAFRNNLLFKSLNEKSLKFIGIKDKFHVLKNLDSLTSSKGI